MFKKYKHQHLKKEWWYLLDQKPETTKLYVIYRAKQRSEFFPFHWWYWEGADRERKSCQFHQKLKTCKHAFLLTLCIGNFRWIWRNFTHVTEYVTCYIHSWSAEETWGELASSASQLKNKIQKISFVIYKYNAAGLKAEKTLDLCPDFM